MAELLLYKGPHWMDALNEVEIEEYEKKYPNFRAKYNRRLRRGDILEVGLDGKWQNPYEFIHIKLPSIDPKELGYLIERGYEGEVNPEKTNLPPMVKERKRYNFQVNFLSDGEKQEIDNAKPLAFTKANLLHLVKDKILDVMIG